MTDNIIDDEKWVRNSFLVMKEDLDDIDYDNRFFTSASTKFTDTTPGGNMCINPPPQFTRTADLKAPNKYHFSKGMGRYYSEAIDDNAQIIHMRFGVPQFNSMTTFFTGFYNSQAGTLARTGRAGGAFYLLGRAAGYVVALFAFPLLAFQMIGTIARYALAKPSSKYYYLKPAMPLYWNAVTTMVNHISVNRGIIPRIGGKGTLMDEGDKAGRSSEDAYFSEWESYSQEEQEKLNEKMAAALPDLFMKNGRIDVYALATRAQRLARARHQAMVDVGDNAVIDEGLGGQIRSLGLAFGRAFMSFPDSVTQNKQANKGLVDYLDRWFALDEESASKGGNEATEGVMDDENASKTMANYNPVKKFTSFLAAELDDGSQFVSFRVNSTGAVSDTFSSSAKESEIASKINGMSSSSRSTRFNMADGNIVGGTIGTIIGAAVSSVKDIVTGIGDTLEVSGLAALAGSAFVDIPKHWDNSTASLPKASYTMTLVSPYGNPVSQLINIYIPLACILAGALPLSTGRQSYTSPFLVEMYDRGRCQTRLGIIDSVSVNRGIGNLGFNKDGHAMGMEVTFSVLDLSTVLHMPIAENFSPFRTMIGAAMGAAAGAGTGLLAGGLLGATAGGATGVTAGALLGAGVFDEDTMFSDYMAVLSGMGMQDQIYFSKRLKLSLTRKMADFSSYFSASHFAMYVGGTDIGRLASGVYRGTPKN